MSNKRKLTRPTPCRRCGVRPATMRVGPLGAICPGCGKPRNTPSKQFIRKLEEAAK